MTGLLPLKVTDGRLAEIEACQTRTMPGGLRKQTATSAGSGVLEVTMSRDGGVEQLFPSMAIARRMLPIALAIFDLRRSAGKTGEALDIAHVAQCTLQSLCRPVQAMEFAQAPQRDGFRQGFQHVAEAFGLDP